MVQEEFCQNCNQRHQCQELYQQLGKSKGPSVVFKVIYVFLLPLMVFIAALAIFEAVSAKIINTKELQTAFAFLLAMLTTFIFVVACSLFVAHRNSK